MTMKVSIPNDSLRRRKMTSIIKGTEVRFRLISEDLEENHYELVGDTSQISDRLSEA